MVAILLEATAGGGPDRRVPNVDLGRSVGVLTATSLVR
jgi:hypothetical protein